MGASDALLPRSADADEAPPLDLSMRGRKTSSDGMHDAARRRQEPIRSDWPARRNTSRLNETGAGAVTGLGASRPTKKYDNENVIRFFLDLFSSTIVFRGIVK